MMVGMLFPQPTAAQDAVMRLAVGRWQGATVEQLLSRYKARVEEHLEGSLRIEIVTDARSPELLLAAVRAGEVEMALLPLQLFNAPDADTLVQPWQLTNVGDARAAQKSEVGARVMVRIETSHGVLGVGYVTTGFTRLATARRPIMEASDLKGLKIRTATVQKSQASLVIAQQGATPVQTAFAEVYTALAAGNIDGVVLPADERTATMRLGETLKHFVEQPYQPIVHVLIVHPQIWRNLNYRAQVVLADAAEEIADEAGAAIAKQEDVLNAHLAAVGSSRQTIPDAVLAEFKAASVASWARAQERGSADYLGMALTRISLTKAKATALGEAPPSQTRGSHPIFFATNRAFENNTSIKLAFGSAPELSSGVNLGRLTIELAADRKLDSDPDRMAKLGNLEIFDGPSAFTQALRGQVQSSRTKQVVIFVHGYNNKFHEALQRAATLREDSAPDAVVLAYSWPSDGAILTYAYDEDMIRHTVLNFHRFMETVEGAVGRASVSLVAHSMGSRVAIDYLRALIASPARNGRFRALVLAAADVQLSEVAQIRNEVKGLAGRVTIYSSAHDRALWLSEDIHRNLRLGRTTAKTIFVEPDIDSIDASDIDSRWFSTRHGYVFDRRAGVVDLKAVLTGQPPSARRLDRQSRGTAYYWKLKE
jgi:esterase/lipase superfamily enzyme/TRAP-type C4-dicarboxylate transport system substrate-binding protein